MTWVDYAAPTTAQRRVALAPVTISASKQGTRMPARVFVCVRPLLLPDLSWWKPDQTVSVQIGRDQHAGEMRIVPNKLGIYHLRLVSGSAARLGVTILAIPPLPGSKIEKREPEPLEFDYSDGWLQIVLPIWARSPDPVATGWTPPVAAPVAAPAPAKTPYRGALGTSLPIAGRGLT